jgi:predicted TIM-barrel fold metal-dependent hydrolase
MDNMQERRKLNIAKLPLRASEYFKRQGAVTISDDPVGLRNLDLVGADNVMWASDYPHDEGTFPHSEKTREQIRAQVSPDEAHALFAGNAARIYGFDLDALESDR